jgi:hypothetical protein
MPNKWIEMSLEQVAASGGMPGSINSLDAQLELQRRQTKAQIDAARYMLWSVIALAITSAITAAFSFLSWYYPQG